MSNENCGLEALRGQAEALLTEENIDIEKMESEELIRVIHELRVHQIELELQNEELRCAHEELQKSRAEYFDLFHFAPIGYLVVDSDGAIQRANLEFTRLVHKDLVEILGKHFFPLVSEDSQSKYVSWLKRLVKTGLSESISIQLLVDKLPGPWVRLQAANYGLSSHEGFQFESNPYFRISIMEIIDSDRKDQE